MATQRISPAAVQAALKGISYPCTKQDLLNKARANGASDEILKALEALPADQFGGPQDVMKAFAEE